MEIMEYHVWIFHNLHFCKRIEVAIDDATLKTDGSTAH